MTPQQEAVSLYQHLEARGFKPSVRSIGRILRDLGLSFTDASLRCWLKDFAAADNISRRSKQAQTPQHYISPAAASRKKEVSLGVKPLALFGINPSQGPERKRKKPKPEPDTGWLTALEAEYIAVATIPIQRLTVEQRLIFSRIVAARFGNYCRDELKNRREGVKLAGQFVRIGDSRRPQFVGMTCREYERFAGLLLEERSGKPFHTAWAVEAVIQA